MKNIFFVLIFYVFILKSSGQECQLYFGENLTCGWKIEHFKDGKQITTHFTPASSIMLGFKNIHGNDFQFEYGIEFGQNKLNNFLGDSTVFIEPDSFGLLKYLKVTHFTVPIIFNYKLNNNFKISLGYVFQYILHKNQNFLFIENLETFEMKSAYNRFHHGIQSGITFTFKKFDFTLSNRFLLTPLFDTRGKVSFNDVLMWENLEWEKMNYGYISLILAYKL